MFQVITRSATAYPACWSHEIEPRMRCGASNSDNGHPENDGARSGGRPGACMSEAFGGNKAHRGDRPVLKRVWSSPRFRLRQMGSHFGKTMPRFSHARSGKNACYA